MPTKEGRFTSREAEILQGARVRTLVDVKPVGIDAHGTVYESRPVGDGYDVVVMFTDSERTPALQLVSFTRSQAFRALHVVKQNC